MLPADASQDTAAAPAGAVGDRARELVAAGEAQGVRLRVLGGVAIALRAGPQTPAVLRRPGNDLDLVVAEGGGRRAGEVLAAAGLVALSERFNKLHGHRRLVFVEEGDRTAKVDVFVGDLEMCHVVPLRRRLEQDPLTLGATDLLLSKGQIARLAEKDRLDLYNLLHNHVVAVEGVAASDASDAVDAPYIAALCARDWGWWRTLTANLASCRERLQDVEMGSSERALIGERIAALAGAIEAAPKSMRWRARARIGERVRWYEEPEEIV